MTLNATLLGHMEEMNIMIKPTSKQKKGMLKKGIGTQRYRYNFPSRPQTGHHKWTAPFVIHQECSIFAIGEDENLYPLHLTNTHHVNSNTCKMISEIQVDNTSEKTKHK